jgi:hypothetical protein
MKGVDTRWTYFQAPFVVEDALGFKFPVPSEYDLELLDRIVRYRFEKGPGSKDVGAGNYELSLMNDRAQVLSTCLRLTPGTHILMAIVLVAPVVDDTVCPMPHCDSLEFSPFPGGGKTWYVVDQQH